MPRAIWKGAISFGLVYVPVEVFPATQSEHTGFNLLDRRTLDPVGYRQINKRTGSPSNAMTSCAATSMKRARSW